MIPICKWDGTCNQKRIITSDQLKSNEEIKKVRVHIDQFYKEGPRLIPMWRRKK